MENKAPQPLRVHAVVMIVGDKKYDPEIIFPTKCGKRLPFKNAMKKSEVLKYAQQCNVCYKASSNQLALPRGWKIVYLHE